MLFGNIQVPYTTMWSGEDKLWVGTCPLTGEVSVLQNSNIGAGKPVFAKPHMNRQREAVIKGLCDICGKPLKNKTKVSLSDARPRINAFEPLDVLQFEPLVHKHCAQIAIEQCPHLQAKLKSGETFIRQVFKHSVQMAILTPHAVHECTNEFIVATGHAKVCLIKWKDRDLNWLTKLQGARS